MQRRLTLEEFLTAQAGESEILCSVADTVRALTACARQLTELIALGPLAEQLPQMQAQQAGPSGGGDEQKGLDLLTHQLFIDALRTAPVAYALSEEQALPETLAPGAPLAVALDPLDGSSNIDANVSVGTIFSILPALSGADAASASFLQTGVAQLAAGFFIYGPQTSLALTLGAGTSLFVLDRRNGEFMQIAGNRRVPTRTQEFAINAANRRHWDPAIRAYVDDCVRGESGPRDETFNMRWIASMVAEAWRILMRGGVYLYPGDERIGYRQGRLRLIYEANPLAMLMEQAGGSATDTRTRILDLEPKTLHERTPLVFGSAAEVGRVGRYCSELGHDAERSPLFRQRGLLRA